MYLYLPNSSTFSTRSTLLYERLWSQLLVFVHDTLPRLPPTPPVDCRPGGNTTRLTRNSGQPRSTRVTCWCWTSPTSSRPSPSTTSFCSSSTRPGAATASGCGRATPGPPPPSPGRGPRRPPAWRRYGTVNSPQLPATVDAPSRFNSPQLPAAPRSSLLLETAFSSAAGGGGPRGKTCNCPQLPPLR